MKKAKKNFLPALVVFVLAALMVSPVFATETPPCPDGCTPGYWKNHEDSWGPTGYFPEMYISDAFGIDVLFIDPQLSFIASDSLMDALKYKGGKGLAGAARIMIRQAVAALLNAAHPDVNYPWSEIAVKWTFDDGLRHGRDYMLVKKGWFEAFNEWHCPLGK